MDALTRWSAPVATKAKPRLTFKQLALLALACVAAVAASGHGYYWWTAGRFIETTDDAYVGGNVTPISPHISGFIAEILVTDNQRVDAGQLLVRLDDRDVRAAADHAEAILKQRTAMLASLRAKYELQQSTIQQATRATSKVQEVTTHESANIFGHRSDRGHWRGNR
jgi:membrane fusion protein, multidrug efflux system